MTRILSDLEVATDGRGWPPGLTLADKRALVDGVEHVLRSGPRSVSGGDGIDALLLRLPTLYETPTVFREAPLHEWRYSAIHRALRALGAEGVWRLSGKWLDD